MAEPSAFGWRSLTLTLSITDGQPNNAKTCSELLSLRGDPSADGELRLNRHRQERKSCSGYRLGNNLLSHARLQTSERRSQQTIR